MKKNKKHEHEIDFWQSSSDLMTGIVLILLLIIALLALLLLRHPDNDYTNYHSRDERNEDEYDHEEEHEDDHSSGGGGGGGGTGHDGDGEGPDDEPGEYQEGQEGVKSAVYVIMVDADTGKTIAQEGVKFDLHKKGNNKLQVLNTYYPVKTSYKSFETTASGDFYLPEKIHQGVYYFRNLSEAKGYGKAANTEFEVDQLYDWPDPLVVKIPMLPARNKISVQMLDADTGEPVSGGSFDIYADEDIVTMDGTVRHKKGDKVGTIKCNNNGKGESKELFLGEYVLKQSDIPEFYASAGNDISVTLEKETEEVQEVKCEKTQATIILKDELTGTPLPDVPFTIDGEKTEELTTDASGRIVLTDLSKETTYTIHQNTAPDDYRITKEETSFKVDEDGRINKKIKTEINITNRVLRVSVDVRDKIFGESVDGIAVAIQKDGSGDTVKSWTTSGAPAEFTDIPEGSYQVIINGNEKKPYSLEVIDTKERQGLTIDHWTTKSYLAVVGIIVATFGGLFLIVKLMKKLLEKRKATKQPKE